MGHSVQIKNALISVYYKDNLEPIIQQLSRLGVNIYSTGGTETFIRNLGVNVIAVEDLTSYPSILGGRVKPCIPRCLVVYWHAVSLKAMSSSLPNMKFRKLIWLLLT